MPCHIAAPIRSGRPAPKYWATNVVRYSPVPVKRATIAHTANSPVTAPATASAEYQVRNRRSTKVWSVNDRCPRISGYARSATSRPPPGPDHIRFARAHSYTSPRFVKRAG